MRILHLSDFHLDKAYRDDATRLVVSPLLESLKSFKKEHSFDIVIFSGDMVNLGGKSYGSLADAFTDFEKVLVEPILKELGLTKASFIMTAGNHDIDRNSDSKILETGVSNFLNSTSSVNEFLQAPAPEGIKRINDYKEFERNFYSTAGADYEHSIFESVHRMSVEGRRVGVASLNSAWRCYGKDDKSNLLIGERQIMDAVDKLSDCEVKIALVHHSKDWLKDFDTRRTFELFKQHFQIVFHGHTHIANVSYVAEPEGQLFTFVASGILPGNERDTNSMDKNGFSVIDYDLDEAILKATFMTLQYASGKYVLNSDYGTNGKWECPIPVGAAIQEQQKINKLIEQLRQQNEERINSHLITYATDTKAPKSIAGLFVMPRLVSGLHIDPKVPEEVIGELEELLNCDQNVVIFGAREAGKTVLLDKFLTLLLEKYSAFRYIPVLMEFKELKPDILANAKEFWGVSTTEVKRLFDNENVLLLIDNLEFSGEPRKLRTLVNFLKEHPTVRLLAASPQPFEGELPSIPDLLTELTFKRVSLAQFQSKQIKSLARKWFPSELDSEFPKRIETITKAFLSFNLPRTPMAVSLFLWILERNEEYKPVNNAFLIENFIERLLSKQSSRSGSRDEFTYTNQLWLLADIAHKMLNAGEANYSISYAEYTSFVEKYLKAKDFEFPVEKIAKELITSGILVNDRGRIRFWFTCFFEFFLAKKMEFDPLFKAHALSEDEFLKFSNEIDYYTGLHRGETEILELVMQRLENSFKELNDALDEGNITPDSAFFGGADIVSALNEETIVKILQASKPSEEEVEHLENEKLERASKADGISTKQQVGSLLALSTLLFLSLRVIRNSEEVTGNDLKMKSYSAACKNLISFSILLKSTLDELLSGKVEIPPDAAKGLRLIGEYFPLLFQMGFSDNVSSAKLTTIVRRKIEVDKASNADGFEKFLSVFLYSDLKGKDFPKYIKAFILSDLPAYLADAVLVKLVRYYYYGHGGASQQDYEALITDLLIRFKGADKSKKSKIMVEQKRLMQKFLKTNEDI